VSHSGLPWLLSKAPPISTNLRSGQNCVRSAFSDFTHAHPSGQSAVEAPLSANKCVAGRRQRAARSSAPAREQARAPRHASPRGLSDTSSSTTLVCVRARRCDNRTVDVPGAHAHGLRMRKARGNKQPARRCLGICLHTSPRRCAARAAGGSSHGAWSACRAAGRRGAHRSAAARHTRRSSTLRRRRPSCRAHAGPGRRAGDAARAPPEAASAAFSRCVAHRAACRGVLRRRLVVHGRHGRLCSRGGAGGAPRRPAGAFPALRSQNGPHCAPRAALC
jgi:hypothetical protein